MRKISGLALLLLVGACGGGGSGGGPAEPQITMTPVPEPMTRATLSGPLCEAEACTCRNANDAGDGGAGFPEGDRKRFELRVGPVDGPLWVRLDDMVLFKSAERATDCFYVDLSPGDHRVVIRASRDNGVSAAVSISELGTKSKSWYETFQFSCGSPGVCAHDELDDFKASLAQYPKGVHDPCGSVKVKQVAWDTGRAADMLHPNDLQVELTLQVYKFVPEHPHGASACAAADE